MLLTTLLRMVGSNEQRLRELCEQVTNEQDPQKLTALADEIFRLLKECLHDIERAKTVDSTS